MTNRELFHKITEKGVRKLRECSDDELIHAICRPENTFAHELFSRFILSGCLTGLQCPRHINTDTLREWFSEEAVRHDH